MRIDGALRPHQGVFIQKNSTGVHILSVSDIKRFMLCHKTNETNFYGKQQDDNIARFNRELLLQVQQQQRKKQQQQQQQQQQHFQIYKWKNAKSLINNSVSIGRSRSNSNFNDNVNVSIRNSDIYKVNNSLIKITYNCHENQSIVTNDLQNSIQLNYKRNNLNIPKVQTKQNSKNNLGTLKKQNSKSKSKLIIVKRVMTTKQQQQYQQHQQQSQQQQQQQDKCIIQFNKIVKLYNLIYSIIFIINRGIINWTTFLFLLQFYWTHSLQRIISYIKNNNKNNVAHIKTIMRTTQSHNGHNGQVTLILYTLLLALLNGCIWPHYVLADNDEHSLTLNNGISTIAVEFSTTTEFDYATRGDKKFGDKCENTMECGFPGSICDAKKKSCQCIEDLPVTNHIDKCGKEAAVNESCFFNEQCEAKYFQTECRDGRCTCRFEMTPIWLKDGTIECTGRQEHKTPEVYVDWAMIGVLIGMALMFIIICIVLRLFSQARWHENRTIFNTPNPRLMNVSLLRESKLLHGQERRGSRMSVRGVSRQPSMTSLRPHSPNPSLGKTGSRSNSNSNASATSLRSNSVAPGLVVNNGHQHHERRPSTYQTQQQQQHHHHHHPQPHHHTKSQSPPPAAHHYQSHQSHQPHHQQHEQHEHHHHQQQQQQQQPLITNITTNPVAESVTVEILEPNNK